LSRPCDNGTSLRNSISWQRESLNNPHHRSAVATAGNFDVGFILDIWAFALGDMRISLQVSTPSGSYVRVMKDRLATIYAKVLFFSTRPFKNKF